MEKSDRALKSTLGRVMMYPLPAFWIVLAVGVLVVSALVVRPQNGPQNGRYTLTCDHPSSGGEGFESDSTCYRLDSATGEVWTVGGYHMKALQSVLSFASEEVSRADLRNVQSVGLEKGSDTEYYVSLYNGTAIEFSEVTFRVRNRLYRTQANLQPFAAGYVEISILPDDSPPGQVVIDSAKGIRRD